MILPEIHKGVKALIFDLDGTLADSLPTHIQCWQKVCASFNYQFDEQILYDLTGMPTHKFAEYIKNDSHCDISIDEIVKLKQSYFYSVAASIKPMQPITKFVKIHSGKILMSIGTGGGRRSAEMILEAIGMRQYFEVIVTADDVVNHKPEPDTFLKCAELMGVEPGFCQVFEDGMKGIEAARKAGMKVTDVRPFYSNRNMQDGVSA